ncbi:hypothetical protein PCC82_23395 [Agrobacterium deltaense]
MNRIRFNGDRFGLNYATNVRASSMAYHSSVSVGGMSPIGSIMQTFGDKDKASILERPRVYFLLAPMTANINYHIVSNRHKEPP